MHIDQRKKPFRWIWIYRNRRSRRFQKKSSEDITRILTDFSQNILHDNSHADSNITQALRIWQESSVSEDDFIELLYQAKKTTLEHSGQIAKPAGSQGQKNRAPYFFKVLRNLVNEAGCESK